MEPSPEVKTTLIPLLTSLESISKSPQNLLSERITDFVKALTSEAEDSQNQDKDSANHLPIVIALKQTLAASIDEQIAKLHLARQMLNNHFSKPIPKEIFRTILAFLCKSPATSKKMLLVSKQFRRLAKEEVLRYLFNGGRLDLYFKDERKAWDFIKKENGQFFSLRCDYKILERDADYSFSANRLRRLKFMREDLQSMSRCFQLTSITSLYVGRLNHYVIVDDSKLSALRNLPNLTELKVKQLTKDDQDFFPVIAGFTQLTSLYVGGCHYHPQQLGRLSNLTNLRTLGLGSCYGLSPENLQCMTSLSNLKILILDYLQSINQEYIAIIKTFTGLTKLKLCVTGNVIDKDLIDSLAELQGLRALDLRKSFLNPCKVELFTSLTRLTFLNLSFCDSYFPKSSEYLTVLQGMPSLRELRVRKLQHVSKRALIALQEKNQNLVIGHEYFDEE